jgi:hypothetical protein
MVKALHPFAPTAPDQIAMAQGEMFTLIDGTGIWWQVKGATGQEGTVPSNYVEKLPIVAIVATAAAVETIGQPAQAASSPLPLTAAATDSTSPSVEATAAETHFMSGNPEGGKLSAAIAAGLLSKSGMPKADLRKVWTAAKAAGPGVAGNSHMDLAEFLIAWQMCTATVASTHDSEA